MPMANEPVAVLERAVRIMNVITSEDEDLGIREIARRTGIHSATVYRIVSTLQGAGLVQQNASTQLYRVGPLAYTWGNGFLKRADLRQTAMPYMQQLRSRFDETVALSMRSGNYRVYMEQLPSNRGVRTTIQVGSPYDLFAGAAGIALLSAMGAVELDAVIANSGLEESRVASLRSLVALAIKRGFASSQQQVLTGVSALASPLTDASGAPWAVSILGPSARIDASFDEIGEALAECARQITRESAGA